MIPNNAIQRTFHIQYGSGIATCFTMDIDGRQYLITARHVVEGIGNSDTIEISVNKSWHSYSCNLVGIAKNDADIAVLSLETQLSPTHPLPPDNNFFLGQDAYFLGFPYGLRADVGMVNNNFPIPFVKKGIISNFFADSKGIEHIYLDGHNNPGFSGGPVVYYSIEKKDHRVAAVISAFESTDEPIYKGDTATGLVYRYNTGIIVSHSISHAVEVIRANPIGVKISA
jgi:hypothetical protein